MIDKRLGEDLWIEWPEDENVYYTPEHVDLEEEIVRRALASTLQRNGVVDSLYEGFESIAVASVTRGWIGSLPEDDDILECDENGETHYGEEVENILPCTFVKL